MRFILHVALIFASLSSSLLAEPFAIYLTWQRDPTTTMTIQWINKENSKHSHIEYKEESATEWKHCHCKTKELPHDTGYNIHVTELKNLQPKTTYYFRIRDEEKIYHFRTMPKELAKPVSFVVGGDTNHEGVILFKDTNRVAAATEPYFAILGGDLAYACSKKNGEKSEEWLEWIQAYSESMITPKGYLIPLLVTIGNHDVVGSFGKSPKNAQFFYSLFAMPGLPGYNSLRFSNYLSLYLLDTSHTNPIKGEQTDWLKQELKKDSHMKTRFAVYHVPAYPSRRKLTSKPTATIHKHWVPLFEDYCLHAAFENHDHNYKRTYPLRKGKIH
ncbi:MAG: conserved putative secreted protein, partial [Chlamydiia bacterium]|nr:conserved putative secreted protein [Chlamydiia bacterium]